MRIATVLLVIFVSMITQSCRIEIPSLVSLLNEYYPYDLQNSRAIRLQSGFKDTLVVGDDPESRHGEIMREVIEDMRVPGDHVVFLERFRFVNAQIGSRGLEDLTSSEYTSLRLSTKVVHVPATVPFSTSYDVSRIAATNILFVLSAGNMHDPYGGDRDQYSPGHIVWRDPFWRDGPIPYENVLQVYDTGKVIAVTSAQVTEGGSIEPFDLVVQCGDIKENCFTVIPIQATSNASARLSAMSFYLSQFWETPEEVVEILGACALDVGAPGIDREYGRGVANLLCPSVLKKELKVVSSHLEGLGRKKELPKGGDLDGIWQAKNVQVYFPAVMQETIQPSYTGTMTGTLEFTETAVIADFKTEAAITVSFLLSIPIEATAEDQVQAKGVYTTKDSLLSFSGRSFSYTADEDSLHLIQSYTLNEVLALLPDPLGSMVDMTSEDFFTNDPIQIRMSFARAGKRLVGDFDNNGMVDVADFLLFVAAFGSSEGDPAYNEAMDLVLDGIINVADFLAFAENFGATSD